VETALNGRDTLISGDDMKKVILLLSLPLLIGGFVLWSEPASIRSAAETAKRREPINVILDTDIGPDCGDIPAVAMLHGLADKGEVNILATMNCIGGEWGPLCLDALNTYNGRPELPVGTLKDDRFLAHRVSFNKEIALRYPHRLKSSKDVPDATLLYRQILAKQPDKSVTIIAIGPLRSLHDLLQSKPDRFSRLNGLDLIGKKVSLLSCMGGWYHKVPNGSGPEWNFEQDAKAAKDVCDNWPTPIMFSDAALGYGIMTGRRVATETSEYNPINLAFAIYPDVGFGQDRASWDQTSILYAVRGLRDYWKETKSGYNQIGDKGANVFTETQDHHHRYLLPAMPIPQLEDVIEDLTVGAREGPLTFDFNVATYAQDGMGAIAAQDEVLPQGAKMHAFDRDRKSVWMAKKATSWIQYQCADGKKYVVSKYLITSGYEAKEHDPESWMLSGSNDGKTWTQLDSRKKQSFNGRGQTREFACENASAYNRYRLRVSAPQDVHVTGIELVERVSNERGVKVAGVRLDHQALTIPVADRAALNVTVLPGNALDKNVVWTSSDPEIAAVKRIGKNTAIVAGLKTGTCQVTGLTHEGRKKAICEVTVTASTLPAPWLYQEVNAPAVPGCATHRDGEFHVTSGGMAIEKWWLRVWDQFGFVNQSMHGDGFLSARLTAQTKSHPHAIAGLMFRETTAKDSRFVMLGVHPSGELFLSWRDNAGDENPRLKLGKVELPTYLKLEHQGTAFHAYVSEDGKNWGSALGTHTGKSYAQTMKVGLCVTARNNPTTSTASFDHVALKEPPTEK
jgi:inosine-uridine nucleoside N-ribohydrolase